MKGFATLTVADDFDSAAGNFVRFDVPAADQSLFDGLTGGERFILAATRIIANVGVEIGNLSTGDPTASVAVNVVGLTVPVEINLSTGNPTVQVSVSTALDPVPVQIGNLSTGSPSVTVALGIGWHVSPG